MANMYAGYQGPTIIDDELGLVYWNADEQMYEKRTGYTNNGGVIYYTGQDGGYDLPRSWFNDAYNGFTGTFNFERKKGLWPILMIVAIVGLVLYILYRKK